MMWGAVAAAAPLGAQGRRCARLAPPFVATMRDDIQGRPPRPARAPLPPRCGGDLRCRLPGRLMR